MKSWSGHLLLWGIILMLFGALYLVARRVVINEIRHHAMGVAIATAAGVDPEDTLGIRGPEDMSSPPYLSIQRFMDRIAEANPDVRYIYVMRRSSPSSETGYEYVVDMAAEDENGNGIIDPEEATNPPGTPYDASPWPEMVRGWREPSADPHVSPDPPYPDLMSGYAPIHDSHGGTVALVGVDVTADTVAHKLLALQLIIGTVWLLISLLSSLVIRLYNRRGRLLAERTRLVDELQDALAQVKTLRGFLPICARCKRIRDDQGYWNQIEAYISEHSEAEFTHGICPDCTRELYPELHSGK